MSRKTLKNSESLIVKESKQFFLGFCTHSLVRALCIRVLTRIMGKGVALWEKVLCYGKDVAL